jgi:hypothetical protein
MGCCGHAVPWLSIISYHHSFLAEPCCPSCARTEMMKQAIRPMCNTLSKVREVVVVEEAGCQAYERLSPGERVNRRSENS